LSRNIFADHGHNILAIDGDPNANLALMLGVATSEGDRIPYIPSSVMKNVGTQDGVVVLEPAPRKDKSCANSRPKRRPTSISS
jgi:CO dehydrogenase nickel-insertion accessory protein CooC1